MKRKILFAFALVMLVCVFSVTALASDTVLEADELSDIHSAVSSAEAGDYITVNLTADIIIPKTSDAIKLTKDITLEINCNNHIIVATHGGGGAGSVYGMYLNSFGARLILNGSLDKVDYVNYVEPTDEKITVSNGVINNPNIGKDTIYPDYASHGPAIVIYSGSVELNNMYINQYNTGEWTIFFAPYLDKTNCVHNIKAVNSIIRAPSSRYAALGTRQGTGYIVQSLVEIEDCVVYGTSGSEWISMSANSYIRNSRIALNSFKIDSYISASYAHDGQEAILENVIFENPSISSNTGAIYVKMINCKFPNGMKLYVTGDSKGKTKFTAIQDPTCENGGGTYFVEFAKGSGKTFTSFAEFPTIVEELPALGHENTVIVAYENGYLQNGYKQESRR